MTDRPWSVDTRGIISDAPTTILGLWPPTPSFGFRELDQSCSPTICGRRDCPLVKGSVSGTYRHKHGMSATLFRSVCPSEIVVSMVGCRDL